MTDESPSQPEQPEQPAFPPDPVPATSGAGSPADLGVRFLARLIDSILVSVVTFWIIVGLFVPALFTNAATGYNFFGGFTLSSIVASLLTAAVIIGYFAFMESRTGQTVGKMLIGLKTVGPDGNPPSMEQAIKRNAFYALSIIPILGGLAQLAAVIYIAVTINSSPTHTGWHDEFAGGTQVLRTK